MNDRAPIPVEQRMLWMVRVPRVTAAMLQDATDDPPERGRTVLLEQTEARVLHGLPPGEQRQYWEQMHCLDAVERRAYQRQAWRYALLKERLARQDSCIDRRY